MYVPWIHGNAPVPDWWRKLLEACEIPCDEEPPAWWVKSTNAARVQLLTVLSQADRRSLALPSPSQLVVREVPFDNLDADAEPLSDLQHVRS